ncbi:MAG: 50S ribosomal protein L13 [Nanoarchaeota archaeon]|nr:50S ribosomal protein L13 [Nanoarchaeota archaeon]
MIIDATNLIAGRLATVVAKKALLGEKIDIVNAEKAIITGTKTVVIAKFRQKYSRGIPLQGPYYPRAPDRILRRLIRGMLPYKQPKGKDAFKRVMCWKGVPEPFKNQKMETMKIADISKIPNLKYVTIGEISKQIGGKVE